MSIHPVTANCLALDSNELWSSIQRLQAWVEGHGYRGYEPFDGLSSWIRPLAFRNEFAERLLLQGIRQCPLNLRPLLGVRPQESTKGRGYMAAGYLLLYRATGQAAFLDRAVSALEWLDQNKAPAFSNHSWSNHFDFVSRGGGYTKHDPIIVWTAVIGHAYLDAFEVTGDRRFLDITDSACRWIAALPRETTSRGDCISYLAHVQSSIHNANMLGAGLLARTAARTGNGAYFRLARNAIEYSCSRQLSDGAWWYAEEPKYHWIDNFHTGYNLDSLDTYIAATGDASLRDSLARGLAFYCAHFFEESGRPRYYHNRTYPVDIQCVAQSIETLARFAGRDTGCATLANKVAAWAMAAMQDADGHFYYRRYPHVTAKTPMLHWGQATMFKALAALFLHSKSCNARRPRISAAELQDRVALPR